MLKTIKSFLRSHFAPDLDLRVQAFHLLALGGVATGVVTGVLAYVTNAGIWSTILSFAASIVGLFMLFLAKRKKCYRLCFLLTVVSVFFLIFPGLFLTGGGYRSGMPSFFVYAIVFTALMLEGGRRTVFVICEFAVYIACCVVAYRFPGFVAHFSTELDYLADVIVGFSVTAFVLLAVVLLYIRIYDNRQNQLDELDRLRIEFFQNMNHEMKTPLAVIISDINNADDMLDYDVDKAAMRASLEHAQEEIRRLARIVEYSLALAAAQEGKRHMEHVDYAALLAPSADAFRSLLKKDGNLLLMHIPDGFPKIMGNRDMLKQVINNLIFNASKHTKNGEIAVSLRLDNGNLITTIKDTGEGIAADMLSRIWERGVSTDETTGYGLSICKNAVEIHGGEMWIESEPGIGTTARFSLPVRWEAQ